MLDVTAGAQRYFSAAAASRCIDIRSQYRDTAAPHTWAAGP
jgi:hypothetical protein